MTRPANDAARGGTRDGYILVAVLGVMLLLTAFMAGGSVLVRSALDSAKVGDDDVAMTGLTQGGLELTAYQLFTMKLPASLVDGRRIRLTGGTIAPVITDESGKVDLNASDPKLLQAAFEATGLDSGSCAAIVKRIVAIRGADRNPSAQPVAPASTGFAAPPPVVTPPDGEHKPMRGFQSLDELVLFDDLTPEDRSTLGRLLTVYNPDGKVNIVTASEQVLAVVPGLGRATLAVIIANRDRLTGPAVAALQSQVGAEASAFTKTTSGPAYTVRIDAAARSGRKKSIEAVIAASKSPNDPYYILDWRN